MPDRRAGSCFGKCNAESPKQDSKLFNCQVRQNTLPIWIRLIYVMYDQPNIFFFTYFLLLLPPTLLFITFILYIINSAICCLSDRTVGRFEPGTTGDPKEEDTAARQADIFSNCWYMYFVQNRFFFFHQMTSYMPVTRISLVIPPFFPQRKCKSFV